MMVAHDPGHGCMTKQPDGRLMQDVGCAHNGLVELQYVLALATDIAAGVPWVQHVLVRATNEPGKCPAHAERANAAKAAGAKLVLCHHVNAADDGARGLMTFYDPADAVGKGVAIAIACAAPAQLRRPSSAVVAATPGDWTKRAHWVIEHYWSLGMPAVLVEWGFATSPSDAQALLAAETRPGMVAAAAAGIARALELIHRPAGAA